MESALSIKSRYIRKGVSYSIFLLSFVLSLLFLVSPLAHTVGLSFKVYIILYIGVVTLGLLLGKTLPTYVLVFGLATIITSLLPAILYSNPTYLFYSFNIAVSLLFVSMLPRELIIQSLEVSSIIMFTILVGAIMSFILSGLGVSANEVYVTSGGREIKWNYFSLGYQYWTSQGTFFRPSGIYDEPGALSFVVCIIAALRSILGMNKKVTWVLLGLGFITLSLAHVIYVTFHFINEKGFRNKVGALGLLGVSFIVLYFLIPEVASVFERLFGRFLPSGDPNRFVEGDNRLKHFLTDFALLSSATWRDFLFGFEGASNCCVPTWPLVQRGVLGSWPYYFALGLLILLSIRVRNWALFAVALLCMQRPSIQSAGYSFLVSAVLLVALADMYRLRYRRFTPSY